MAEVPEIQSRIDALQNKFHDQCDDLGTKRDMKWNKIYEERTKVLKEKAPKNFWATVIQTHPDISTELMGPYDAKIMESLEDFSVIFTETGYKLSVVLGKNDFIESGTLWAEDNDGDFTFSGVTWKEGKGPREDDDDDEAPSKPGEKRPRADDGRGPSIFEVFSIMPPHPDEDDEMDEEDDDEFEDAVEQWEEDMDDRREVLSCLVGEVWADPARVLAASA